MAQIWLYSPRQWTPLSHWKLREFNEMPHFFQRRLAASYEPAQMYISQFPSTMAAVIAQAMAYIAGSVVCYSYSTIINNDLPLPSYY